VERLEAAGLIERIEDHTHTVPHGDRGGVPIEPWLTEQWYVDAATLAKPAIESVEQGRTVFVPKNWEKTYFEWMRNIQPWCISRQLWWGHQIPAWYGGDGEIFVEETENLALAAAERHYGSRVMLTRDEDVLDTWFSSALWPFSTLGWPEETPELKRFYPTNVLVTGFDIIFFWVARMMMFGLHFMEREPFDTVYIHALVRDAKGQKMSKSKGNVIDPLDLIQDYGADALRFTLAAMAAQGRDIKMAPGRVEGYRNFGTKLWNAARFCEMSGVVRHPDFDPVATRLTLNRWIAGELVRTRDAVTKGIEEHRYNDAAAALYSFTWHVFCDWYLELIKPILAGDDEAAAETRHAAAWVLDQILLLLHPFMPFLTEELWQRTAEAAAPRQRPHPRPLAGLRGPRRRAGRGRDQLGHRARLVHPLGALGNERAGLGPHPLRHRRGEPRDPPARLPLADRDRPPGAARLPELRRHRARWRRPDRARRIDRRLAARRGHRSRRRARPPREGTRQGGQGHRGHRRPPRQPGLSRQGARRRRRGSPRPPHRPRSPQGQDRRSPDPAAGRRSNPTDTAMAARVAALPFAQSVRLDLLGLDPSIHEPDRLEFQALVPRPRIST
jgi:hypothetical protein